MKFGLGLGLGLGSALLAMIALPATALAGPGGQTFTGKVKCTRIYNSGTAGPIKGSDEVTLTFVVDDSFATGETGTGTMSHTNTTVSGLFLGPNFEYASYVNTEESLKGMLLLTGTSNPTHTEGGVAEFSARSDGSVKSLRIVFHHYDDNPGSIERCDGNLKAQ